MASLFQRLKEERNKSGYTQGFVASHTGINRVCIAQIESGKRKVSADDLRAFCALYGVSADYLLFGMRQQEKEPALSGISLLNDKDREEVLELVGFLVKKKLQTAG